MPFKSISDLPSNIKKLSTKKQRQFLAVFNSAFKRAKKKGLGKKGADSSAFRQANSVVFSQAFGGERGQRELLGDERAEAIEHLKSKGQYKERRTYQREPVERRIELK